MIHIPSVSTWCRERKLSASQFGAVLQMELFSADSLCLPRTTCIKFLTHQTLARFSMQGLIYTRGKKQSTFLSSCSPSWRAVLRLVSKWLSQPCSVDSLSLRKTRTSNQLWNYNILSSLNVRFLKFMVFFYSSTTLRCMYFRHNKDPHTKCTHILKSKVLFWVYNLGTCMHKNVT